MNLQPEIRPEATVDVLAIGAHPDDIELSCGGTLALLAQAGRRVGMLHLTRGETSTRGTVEERAIEAEDAAIALGVIGQVIAGAERLAIAAEDDRVNVRVGIGRLDRLGQQRRHLVVDGVQDIGTVQGDAANAAGFLKQNFGHARLSPCFRRVF